MCVSDATSTTPQSPATEDSDQAEDKSCATTSQQSYEKQGSLITLAWGKLLEDNTDCEAEATGQSQDVESGLKTQIQPSERSSVGENVPFVKTSGETDKEDVKPVLVQSESSGHLQSAEQQFSTLSQVLSEQNMSHCVMHLILFSLVFSLVDVGRESNSRSKREYRSCT